MSEKERLPYYINIPSHVLYADISPNAKILYGYITGLCSKEGYCWASNNYFQDILGLKKRQIQNLVTELEESGFIKAEISRDGGLQRKIQVVDHNLMVQNNAPGMQNNALDGAKNCIGGCKKLHTSNTIDNNKKNNYSSDSYEYTTAYRLLKDIKERGMYSVKYEKRKGGEDVVVQEWADIVNQLSRLDEYTEDEITRTVDWLLKDDWWIPKGNFRTAKKFRQNDKNGIPYFEMYLFKANNIQNTKPIYQAVPQKPYFNPYGKNPYT